MKLAKLLFSSVAALGLLASNSQAANSYLSFDAGALILDDVSVDGFGGISFDTSFAANVSLGYNIDKNLAVEAQVGYAQVDYSAENGPFSFKGDSTLIPVFANVKYSTPIGGSSVSFEIGAGVGYIYSDSSATASAGDLSISGEGSGWDFGFQGLAGLNFKLGDNTDLKVGYRLLAIDSLDDNQIGHYIGAGVTFKF